MLLGILKDANLTVNDFNTLGSAFYIGEHTVSSVAGKPHAVPVLQSNCDVQSEFLAGSSFRPLTLAAFPRTSSVQFPFCLHHSLGWPFCRDSWHIRSHSGAPIDAWKLKDTTRVTWPQVIIPALWPATKVSFRWPSTREK